LSPAAITVYQPNYYILRSASNLDLEVVQGLFNDAIQGLAAPDASTRCVFAGAPLAFCGKNYAKALIDGACFNTSPWKVSRFCGKPEAYVEGLKKFLTNGTIIAIQLGNEPLGTIANGQTITAAMVSTAAQNLRTVLDADGFPNVHIVVSLVEGQEHTFCQGGAPPTGVDFIAAHPYCNYVASVQITLSEDFGVQGRGAFYETAGCLRDVIENHLFQVVALLAMEPPAGRDFGAVHSEKAKVFQAMRPLKPDDLVRGQYAGYRKEPDVAKSSDVETFCALRLFIDSWRWEGVPWYLRSGKYLADTATEVMVELKPPPQRLFADSAPIPKTGPGNYLRFRLSPNSAIALAARVKLAGKEFVGDQRELYLFEERPREEAPYERLLGDAMAGDGALFTREDAVEAAWAVVDPVLKTHQRARPYKRHSWGPKEADAIIASGGCWHNPRPEEASASVGGGTTKGTP